MYCMAQLMEEGPDFVVLQKCGFVRLWLGEIHDQCSGGVMASSRGRGISLFGVRDSFSHYLGRTWYRA